MEIKTRKLCSNEDNIVRCSAVENIENVTLQENQFHSQQLHIYEQRNECITPEVILHRDTGIPGDGNCLFHSLISVLQLQIESCDLRNQLRDSPYLNSCHNPQEAYNILSSSNDYGDLDCLYLFSKMYNQNICVHYCFYNITTTNEDTIFCHFKANDTQNWIHLHLREQHFTPFYEVSDLFETVQDATQNEAHGDANIELYRDNYDEDPTEDNHNNHENEIEIDREDRIGENNMDFIDDGTIPVYTNYRKHSISHIDFYNKFTSNLFGHSCIICDRLWWKRDLKKSTSKHESILKTILQNYIPGEIVQVCSTCYTSLQNEKIPLMSTYNGFAYPKIPSHLPTLNLIEQRLISPRVPFMQIRRLRHVNGQYGIYGQIINVPVEVNTMVKQLPRNIEDDHCFYVHLKKKLIHKTSYVHGLINKSHIKEWLSYLVSTPLYIHYDIKIDESFFTGNERTSQLNMDEISEHVPIEDNLVAQQQTLLWNDDYFLSIAPAEYNRPVSILMDEHAEELSFPTIYGGQFRTYRDGVIVTPFMQATSELRRTDRRATDPQHLLYIAVKIMRLRIILDEYACATYVVEYVNKHNRGISNLQRQIIDIMDEHPEFDIVDITKKMSIDILQSVEMPAQEAAWYLLREPMAQSSVVTVYIPTVFPTERTRSRKSMKELEALDDDCTNIWKENWLDKYEKRPEELRDVTLAQFVAKYYLNTKGTYTKRDTARIIRYRNYDMADNYNDYRREMVLLHVPFQSEENDIIAENKFIQIYEDNKDTILERRKEFESNLDIEKTLEICRQLCRENDEEQEDEELLRAVDILHERDPYDLLLRDPNSTAN
ncbi:uncharacterized protein LOC120782016, partial [Bactrocera tryoni]|uniref:uncharacterized protein LOC120782016 n=1 Tax=Bactrocera tryoni TaxID=59916 RepID=UPI001A956EF2